MATSALKSAGRKAVRPATPLLIAGALAISSLAAAGPAAADSSAETSVAAAAFACELHTGTTHKSGTTIVGFGSQADCGSSGVSYLTIQRSRWYGWEDLATATVVGSGYDQYVRYNCSGTGTHTYRTIHTGRTIGGDPRFKESNHLRVSC